MNHARRNFAFAAGALGFGAAFFSFPALASDATDAKGLVQKAQVTINAFAANPDYASLRPALGKAKAVLIFPQILKAGFILGGSGGSGVLLVRNEKTGTWSGPAFYTMGAASLGFQAGASAAEVVMVVHTQKALDSLYSTKVKLGADASVAAGPKGIGTGAAVDADFIVYAKVKGAFAGLAVEGSVLDVREKLNEAFYGKPVTPVDILVSKTVSNPSAAGLQAAVKKTAK
jgi:lipid-binding SYLF domain-containing protein